MMSAFGGLRFFRYVVCRNVASDTKFDIQFGTDANEDNGYQSSKWNYPKNSTNCRGRFTTKFEALPKAAQDIIQQYAGAWSVTQSNKFFEGVNTKAMQQLVADPKRHVIFPSPTDRMRIDAAFKSMIDSWVARDPRNAELLSKVRSEIAQQRVTR